MIPNENHGYSRNIILDDIKAAAQTDEAGNITPEEAVQNLDVTWEQKVSMADRGTTEDTEETA